MALELIDMAFVDAYWGVHAGEFDPPPEGVVLYNPDDGGGDGGGILKLQVSFSACDFVVAFLRTPIIEQDLSGNKVKPYGVQTLEVGGLHRGAMILPYFDPDSASHSTFIYSRNNFPGGTIEFQWVPDVVSFFGDPVLRYAEMNAGVVVLGFSADHLMAVEAFGSLFLGMGGGGVSTPHEPGWEGIVAQTILHHPYRIHNGGLDNISNPELYNAGGHTFDGDEKWPGWGTDEGGYGINRFRMALAVGDAGGDPESVGWGWTDAPVGSSSSVVVAGIRPIITEGNPKMMMVI